MKFSFIVTAMILNFASSNNPNSININLETAFEFEPKNNKQHLLLIDDIQQFLTKLRSALNPDGTEVLRSKKDFNICHYIKDTLNAVAKYENNDLEAFFQALRSDIKARYNSANFRAIFHDKSVRGYIKKTFADLNRTSPYDKKAMLKFGAIAMNAEPEYLNRLNEFFSENDKETIKKYIDEINNYPSKGKDFNDLVKRLMDFLIFKRYAKLDDINKSKVKKLINGFGSLNNYKLRANNNNFNPKQRDFVLSNNLEIAVKAVSKTNNNQFNIQIQPILDPKTQPTAVTEFEAKKVKKSGKKSKTTRLTSKTTKCDKVVETFKENSNFNQNEVNDDKQEHKIKHTTVKVDKIDEIIDKDIKNLLEYNVIDDGDKTTAGIETTKQKRKEKTSETENKNRLKLIDAPIGDTDEESQESDEKTTKTSHKKNKQDTKKTTKNNSDNSDSESEKTIENQEAQFRNNENAFLGNNNDIIETATENPMLFLRAQSAEFAAKKNVGSKNAIVSKVSKKHSKTSKKSSKNQKNNSKTRKEKNEKGDIKNDDDDSNLENEMKSRENSEEKRNREAFEKAELNFKILETKFSEIKNKGDDLTVVKPPPKEAFRKINRNLGI